LGVYDERDRKAKEKRKRAQDEASRRSAVAKAAGWEWARPKVLSAAQAQAFKRSHASADQSQNPGLPYRKTADEILSALGTAPADQNKSYVSSFSDWVFSKYGATTLSAAELNQRAEDEIQIDLARWRFRKLKHQKELDERRESYTKQVAIGGWEVIYKHFGPYEEDALKISALQLNDGSCMYGKPDIVLYQKRTRKYLVVEIKSSSVRFPPNDGWPNLRAQLWAYSKADLFEKATEVILGAEVYYHRQIRSYSPTKLAFDNNKSFNDENSRLFSQYVEATSQNT